MYRCIGLCFCVLFEETEQTRMGRDSGWMEGVGRGADADVGRGRTTDDEQTGAWVLGIEGHLSSSILTSFYFRLSFLIHFLSSFSYPPHFSLPPVVLCPLLSSYHGIPSTNLYHTIRPSFIPTLHPSYLPPASRTLWASLLTHPTPHSERSSVPYE